MESIQRYTTKQRLALAGAVLSVPALAGCGSSEAAPPQPEATASSSSSNSISAEGNTVTVYNSSPMTFDALGGGSNVIDVYAGPSSNAQDTVKNGTYLDGQTVGAECKTEGREVHSHPEVGEHAKSSNEWIRFHDTNEVLHYATAVYVENSQELLAAIEDC